MAVTYKNDNTTIASERNLLVDVVWMKVLICCGWVTILNAACLSVSILALIGYFSSNKVSESDYSVNGVSI
jgi:hypothetical protein